MRLIPQPGPHGEIRMARSWRRVHVARVAIPGATSFAEGAHTPVRPRPLRPTA